MSIAQLISEIVVTVKTAGTGKVTCPLT